MQTLLSSHLGLQPSGQVWRRESFATSQKSLIGIPYPCVRRENPQDLFSAEYFSAADLKYDDWWWIGEVCFVQPKDWNKGHIYYIKDFGRDSKLGQLGPGVIEEKSPLTPRHLGETAWLFLSKVPDEPKADGFTPGATDGRPTPWSSRVRGGWRPGTPPTLTLAKAKLPKS